MEKFILFPGILSGMRSRKDKSFAITFETQELNPEQASGLMSCLNDFGYIAFKNEPYRTDDKELLASLKTDILEDNSKTPSQQFRAVLYRNWEQKNEGYKVFADYYRAKYEIIITHFKGKLE